MVLNNVFFLFKLYSIFINSIRCNKTDTFFHLESYIKIFKIGPFDEIITLGSCCLPKWRLLSYIKRKKSTVKNRSGLFDWMVPLNYTLFGEAVQNDLLGSFEPNFLSVRPIPWSANSKYLALYNIKYEFVFNHAFDLVRNFKLSNESFLQMFPIIRDKMVYLTNNSLAAFKSTQNILYIIYAAEWPSSPEGQGMQDFINLVNSIRRKRNNNFLVLVLTTRNMSKLNNYILNSAINDNLIIIEIDFYNINEWHSKESIEQWDKIFDIVLRT